MPVQLPVGLSVGLVRLSVRLSAGLPVGLVRLSAQGYPPEPPVGDFGGCTPPGPEMVGATGAPTVDPTDRVDRLDRPVVRRAPAAG